jgi:Lon protease-like protein
VGTSAQIMDFHQLSDGLLGLSCVGRRRFRVQSRQLQSDGLNLADVSWLDAEPQVPVPQRHAHLAELIQNVLPQLGEVYANMEMRLDDASWVGNRLAEILPIDAADKQFCLELEDPVERLDFLAPLIQIASDSDEPEGPATVN